MPPEPTARDCVAACDRLAARLDLLRAQLRALPPPDSAELQALYDGAEAALLAWDMAGALPELPELPEPEPLDWPPAEWDGELLPDPPPLALGSSAPF